MEKLHYLGLLFLNFAILNILLSPLFLLLSIAAKRFLSSPLLRSRLFFISLIAPPALSFLTVLTSFVPPLFVKMPGRSMLCLNEPYCYIFSLVSPEIPLFGAFLIAAAGLTLLPAIYSLKGIVAYLRVARMETGYPLRALDFSPGSPGEFRLKPYTRQGKPDTRRTALRELKDFAEIHKIRVRIIDTPQMVSLLLGYFSNRLILSTGVLKRLSADELRALLAHEQSHHKRKDNILKAILLLCRNSLFFFPHVHYIYNWWLEEIELIGDERAAISTGKPLDVASALLKMEIHKGDARGSFPGHYAAGFYTIAQSPLLTERVERLAAIHDGRIRSDRKIVLPSELSLLVSAMSLFPAFFMAVYEFDPLLVHCYLEKLLSLG